MIEIGNYNSLKNSSKEYAYRKFVLESFSSGVQLKLIKKYSGKSFSFYMTCILPIYFDYFENSCIHPSFIVETLDGIKILKNGNWNENCTAKDNYCFSFSLTWGYCELVMLETPVEYQHKGFAGSALDIIKDIIIEYNKFIEIGSYQMLKDLRKIKYITGEAIPCGNCALNFERLINFYKKNGFSVNNTNKILLIFEK